MVYAWSACTDVIDRSSGAGGVAADRRHALRLDDTGRSPIGSFATIDGTCLHYLDVGAGVPVVLLHGNGSLIGDFVSSGLVERAASDKRIVVFDRPGFGHSARPSDRVWTPAEQARLLLGSFAQLGIERPIVVGHSWGALVAVAMALHDTDSVAGLVLLSGYYYPTPRAETEAIAQIAAMVNPFMRGAIAAAAIRRVFAPLPVPERFQRAYPLALALRPARLQVVREEAAMLVHAAEALSRRYSEISVPVRIIAGTDDRVVETEKHSARLHRVLPASTYRRVPGCGHMVHHAAPDEVLAAIAAIAATRPRSAKPPARQHKPVQRRWLHIGEAPSGRQLEPIV